MSKRLKNNEYIRSVLEKNNRDVLDYLDAYYNDGYIDDYSDDYFSIYEDDS